VQEGKNAFDNIFCFLIAFWAVLPRLSTAQKAQIFCRFLQGANVAQRKLFGAFFSTTRCLRNIHCGVVNKPIEKQPRKAKPVGRNTCNPHLLHEKLAPPSGPLAA
jgi:hypothetical protein